MKSSAILSRDLLYRYELRREWNSNAPPFVIGMLNPSKADHRVDDPTITRCIRRAGANGCGSLIVWNLGAGRATDPDAWKRMADPIGPDNDMHIERILIECRERRGTCVIGWGNHGGFMDRDTHALGIALRVGVRPQCLGLTGAGYPRHPLYVGAVKPLEPFACA